MIGPTMKKIRVIFGYSGIEMCSALGISRSYLSEIESGVKQPSMKILQQFSDLTGIKMSSLILLSEKYEETPSNARAITAKLLNDLIGRMAEDANED